MKEKIKKIFEFLLNNWTKFAEIGTVIWSIWGMWQVVTFHFPTKYLSENEIKFAGELSGRGVNILLPELLFYFFSVVLILYLLRKYERKN